MLSLKESVHVVLSQERSIESQSYQSFMVTALFFTVGLTALLTRTDGGFINSFKRLVLSLTLCMMVLVLSGWLRMARWSF